MIKTLNVLLKIFQKRELLHVSARAHFHASERQVKMPHACLLLLFDSGKEDFLETGCEKECKKKKIFETNEKSILAC